ncbi:DUF4249 domain-containing protein [Mucilaginibacter sp. HMF5004]|uniref:DUF4249 domain-containing protein n=1 Tax=Mucilaginibacter rivuli TaxID=2857527 RepID=UPI001C5E3C44|nr:DUF4249 domain-containing protein [Mucilaginibacter rivuli]MBW4888935.1 DUF4249 domain-containing protein [Mucilaginibacter rivuli]
MIQKKFILLAILACLATFILSCEKASTTVSDKERPVVEAFLVPGSPIQVKVYYQKYLDDTISYGYPVTGLKLKISDGTNTINPIETSPGVYIYSNTAFVKDNKTYSLSFAYNGNTVTAQTTVPSKPVGFKASATQQYVPGFSFGSTPKTFTPVVFSWTNPNSDYFLMVFQDTTSNPNPLNSGNTTAYKDSEVILGQVVSYQTSAMTFTYLGNYNVLLYHINKEYSDALNSSGGTSLNLTNPATNVVNGLGIFTAMRADTVSLLVYQ